MVDFVIDNSLLIPIVSVLYMYKLMFYYLQKFGIE